MGRPEPNHPTHEGYETPAYCLCFANPAEADLRLEAEKREDLHLEGILGYLESNLGGISEEAWGVLRASWNGFKGSGRGSEVALVSRESVLVALRPSWSRLGRI